MLKRFGSALLCHRCANLSACILKIDVTDSGRNSDDGADDSDVTEQCQEEDLGSVFTAVEAYDSSSAEDIGPYWNTLECTPYYEPIE